MNKCYDGVEILLFYERPCLNYTVECLSFRTEEPDG